jgi:uncharacterized SAM-binding protein YcdF (DUF218 family)
MKSILLILLGCDITTLLMDRVNTAITFIENNKFNFNNISWYLSGGIKFEGTHPEALIMKNELENAMLSNNVSESAIFNYILDEHSTNTAENFYRASKHLNHTNEEYDEIYIITSKFHYNRAKLMLSFIDTSREYKWILGDLQQSDSIYWENIHITNVANDVNKLLYLEQI